MITIHDAARWVRTADTDPDLIQVVDAVNATVTRWHGDTWPGGVELGALMLAARLYRRRNSPAGVEALTEMGASYVARYDADLDRQLQIHSWSPPRVG